MVLVEYLIEQGWLKTPNIIEAFRKIKRKDFLTGRGKDLAGLNTALPIGYGQTISQPLVVAFMLELLQPRQGEKILDIGSGSGWTTALLAEIVGEKGRIISIEIVPELKIFGETNVDKYGFVKKGRVKFICADGSKGCKQEALFDKILCSATIQGEKLPIAWKKQLKIRGRIVAPLDFSIWVFEKLAENNFKSKEYPGFTFVPLIKKER